MSRWSAPSSDDYYDDPWNLPAAERICPKCEQAFELVGEIVYLPRPWCAACSLAYLAAMAAQAEQGAA